MVERQPAGRSAYEYDNDPYPPLVETAKVTFSPGKRLGGEAVNEIIEGSEVTNTCVASFAWLPGPSITVQTTLITPGAL